MSPEILVVVPLPPANLSVSVANEIVALVYESSTIVKSVDTLAVEALVILP